MTNLSEGVENLRLIEEELMNNSSYLKLKDELEKMKAAEQKEALRIVKNIINRFELNTSKICSDSGSSPRKKVEPKYRNIKTGETWTGRGRKPVSYVENPDDWVEI